MPAASPGFVYVPVLKRKQGEQIALRYMPAQQRALTLPLIEWVPLKQKEGQSLKDALKIDLEKAARTLKQCSADAYPVAVDTLNCRESLPHPARLLVVACKYFASQNLLVWPVLWPSMVDAAGSMLGAELSQFRDVVIRIRTTAYVPDQVAPLIAQAAAALAAGTRIHVLIDMGSIVGGDAATLARTAVACVQAAVAAQAESVTLAGGSFPFNLTGIKTGVTMWPRVEWAVWTSVRNGQPQLRFGDYTVTNPAPLAEIDPRKVNPSVAIRYALAADWMLIKAGGVRTGPKDQYNGLCRLLVADTKNYSGKAFSYGDARYDAYAQPAATSGGNPSSWRCDATSHHLALTVQACAKLSGLAT